MKNMPKGYDGTASAADPAVPADIAGAWRAKSYTKSSRAVVPYKKEKDGKLTFLHPDDLPDFQDSTEISEQVAQQTAGAGASTENTPTAKGKSENQKQEEENQQKAEEELKKE